MKINTLESVLIAYFSFFWFVFFLLFAKKKENEHKKIKRILHFLMSQGKLQATVASSTKSEILTCHLLGDSSFSSTPHPLRERVEFQVELLRNLEIRLRGTSVGHTCPTQKSCCHSEASGFCDTHQSFVFRIFSAF